ncbi:DedA family protein [Altererythrobacter sp. FM1]|uniref:DedA family protein n=1 Tax=Tsuneonella flava TaxID=2055955 RepID=UPI000C80924E|nr:DedA family protein [Tsuneonella flava]ROT95470.1 DedA family protein [Altererythrobacter sp. FM1]
MHDLIIEAIRLGGYWGIFFLMVLENVIPPVPSEVIMGIGGVLVARGQMDFWPLLFWGTVGSTLGNYAWFWVGEKWGRHRLEPFIARWGRWLTVEWEDIERAIAFFRKHGQWVVFACRFSPFLRTMISLPAGLARMNVWRFLIFTFVGAAIWNTLLIWGGTWLAGVIGQYENAAQWVIAGLVVLSLIWYGYRVVTWKPRHLR